MQLEINLTPPQIEPEVEKARQRQRKIIAFFTNVPLQDLPKFSRTDAEELLEIVKSMEIDLDF